MMTNVHQVEARPSCFRAGVDVFAGTPSAGDYFGYRHCVPFCWCTPNKETMLLYSQPAYYRAVKAIEARDVDTLAAILSLNPRLRDPHESVCCLPCIDGQYHCDYPLGTPQCCCPFVVPGVSPNSFLRASNPTVHRAIKAIRKGDAAALARLAKGKPALGAEGVSPEPTPHVEMPCYNVNCHDCSSFGADRCDGTPRRCCGDSWCHIPYVPFACFLPLFRFSRPWVYRARDEVTVRSLATQAFGAAIAEAALGGAVDPAAVAAMDHAGVVVLRTLGSSTYEVRIRPGPARFLDIVAAAQQQHVELRGDKIQLTRTATNAQPEAQAPALPKPASTPTWTSHKDVDMCGQGDAKIIGDWKKKHSIADLKKIVEEKGYSGFSVGNFGHAALKRFDYQLTVGHCKPTKGYTCTIHIYDPTGGAGGATGGTPDRRPGPGSRWDSNGVDITDPVLFASEKIKQVVEPQREICFAMFDNVDLCFGADRCKGHPRRCGASSDIWCHPPPCLCCLPTLRMPDLIHRYVPATGTAGNSIIHQALATEDPGLAEVVAGYETVLVAADQPVEMIATFVAAKINKVSRV